jgi:outer membrane lipoprotein SlyB
MKQYVYLLILPIMFLISCSDDTVEETGSSNHVLLERYPQEVINISMDNPERVRLVVQELVFALSVIGTVSGTALGGWSGVLVGVATFC